MKKLLLLIVSSALVGMVYAQNDLKKKADRYFNQYEYAQAVTLYEDIRKENPSDVYVVEKLVQCYSKLNNPQKAEPLLEVLTSQNTTDAIYIKMYAQVLASNGKYNASLDWYKKYLNLKHDEHVKGILTSYDGLSSFYQDSTFYKIEPLSINSKQADFSPAYYRDGIVFCSARNIDNKRTYKWNNTAYIDLFFAKDASSAPTTLGMPINTKLHEGPATFSENFDTVYFTRNNFMNNKKSNSSEGVVKLKIYYSVFKNGTWQKEQSLSLNNDEYSIGHPALSADGKLYFASDMPGGFGGTDIYYTTFFNGYWTKPVNLGASINTSGNEIFPYVDAKGDLYFSSSLHPGLGGLDIFYAKVNTEGFSAPQNLGHPVNSSKDDFGLIIKNDHGYFSSNRGNDSSNDDLYSFHIDKTKILKIQAVNKEGAPIENFTVTIIDSKDELEKQVPSILSHVFNCEEKYTIVGTKEGYVKQSITLSRPELIRLASEEIVTITLLEAIKNVQVVLKSTEGINLPGGSIEMHNTATSERKNLVLDKSATTTVQFKYGEAYELKGSKNNFKNKVITLDNIASLDENTPLVIALLPADVLFEKTQVGESIELEIRYDVNKATIRPDAAKELDKLIVFLKKNPTAKVELGSHTDIRGSNEANLKLSQKRAESAVRYIIKKGISSKRLIPIGFGEDELKVKDATTEEGHQQNRRTTVRIVAI